MLKTSFAQPIQEASSLQSDPAVVKPVPAPIRAVSCLLYVLTWRLWDFLAFTRINRDVSSRRAAGETQTGRQTVRSRSEKTRQRPRAPSLSRPKSAISSSIFKPPDIVKPATPSLARAGSLASPSTDRSDDEGTVHNRLQLCSIRDKIIFLGLRRISPSSSTEN